MNEVSNPLRTERQDAAPVPGGFGPRGHVEHHGITKNVIERVIFGDVSRVLADDNAQLQLGVAMEAPRKLTDRFR